MGSLTSPNPEAQTEAIRKAYNDAQLRPAQVDFVELHGTGTKVRLRYLVSGVTEQQSCRSVTELKQTRRELFFLRDVMTVLSI